MMLGTMPIPILNTIIFSDKCGEFSHNLHTLHKSCVRKYMVSSRTLQIQKYQNDIKFSIIIVITGCVVVTAAPHLCDARLWPCQVLSFHTVVEQQKGINS